MKALSKIKLSIVASIVFISAWMNAQQNTAFYYFEGDEVVFQFNGESYLKAAKMQSDSELAFDDLDIKDVLVSSAHSNWSKDDWSMKEVGPNVFQLRKKIKAFGDGFSWDFKFLVNQKYWVEPTGEHGLFTEPNDMLESVFGFDPYDELINKDGNTSFYLDGFANAKKVILTGSFVEWNEHKIEMKRVGNGWRTTIQLPLGRYEYKFIVDGEWYHDAANDRRVRNEHGTFNSVLTLQKDITFILEGFKDAKKVFIAGTFNNWKEKSNAMKRQEDSWSVTIPLNSGKYFYKFIVDGRWLVDPNNPISETDVEGNINSVLFVN